MKPMHIAMALLSAAMFFVLAGVFMGVQLELDGTKLVVDTASDIRWQWVFIGTAVVFFFQLLRPAFQKGLKSVSGPKFILPAIDGSTVKQKLFLVALLVLAVAWPFMVSRGTVDIATLTMIYIILALIDMQAHLMQRLDFAVVGADFVKGQHDFFHLMPHLNRHGSRPGYYGFAPAYRLPVASPD